MRQIGSAVWRRLERLEKARTVVKHVGGWPPIIYDPDEWQALAVPMQQALQQWAANNKD